MKSVRIWLLTAWCDWKSSWNSVSSAAHLAILPVALELCRIALNGVRGHYNNSVCLKVVAQFPGRNKYGIDKLMRLKIPGLCLVEDFADIVDWLLDGPDPGDRVRLAFIHHVRSLGPQRFWVPTGMRLLRTPLSGVRTSRQR